MIRWIFFLVVASCSVERCPPSTGGFSIDDLAPRARVSLGLSQRDLLGKLRRPGVLAPEFSLTDASGSEYVFLRESGHPRWIVFFLGAQCLQCVDQLTQLRKALARLKVGSVEALAISPDSPTQIKKALLASSLDWSTVRFLSDPSQTVFEKYDLQSGSAPLHGTFLISERGEIVWRDTGEHPFEDTDFLLSELYRLWAKRAPKSGKATNIEK